MAADLAKALFIGCIVRMIAGLRWMDGKRLGNSKQNPHGFLEIDCNRGS